MACSALSLRLTREGLEHALKLFDADLQILDDAAQCLALEFALMHRDHDTRLIALPYINGVTATLTPEQEAQSFGNTNQVLRCGCRQLRRHTGISIGFMKMSSAGIGKPSSTRLSMYRLMASRMLSTPSSMVSLCVWHPGKVGQKTW